MLNIRSLACSLGALLALTLSFSSPARGEDSGHARMRMAMHGLYGLYPMHRDASGTSWQPDSTPMEGLHLMRRGWMFMLHGFATAVYDRQGGPRGDEKVISTNMLMGMAQRPLGPGTLGLRSMLTLEPATIGRTGYPLLLQTGETADGFTPLVDRQHPHDLFMELAGTYSLPFNDDTSAFAYFGYPGEPALGPTTFMHRFSGLEIPEAPITHHWLDSTHVTFGVATAGLVWKDLKLEGSRFTGREPNQYRWDFDPARFDSYSGRVSYNPTPHWALQASYGHIKSPEQLEPDADQNRWTASGTYDRPFGSDDHWQATFAWGQNQDMPGDRQDAYLLEATAVFAGTHTVFARGERVNKNELFLPGSLQAGGEFTVNKISWGYIFDVPALKRLSLGIGGLGSVALLPEELRPAYGNDPWSFMLFTRLKLI